MRLDLSTPTARAPGSSAVPTTPTGKTKAIAVEASGDVSLSVREIENGFIVCESHYGQGRFVERETFSETAPEVKATIKVSKE